MSRARTTSPVASARVFPSSRLKISANSFWRASRIWLALSRMAPRAGAGIPAHAGSAALAAATAALTSSAVAEGKAPMTSSVLAGLRFSKVAPLAAATHSPAIRFLKVCMVVSFGAAKLQHNGKGVWGHQGRETHFSTTKRRSSRRHPSHASSLGDHRSLVSTQSKA